MTGKRLSLDTYSVPHAWHLTIRAAAGTAPFAEDALVRHCVEHLRASAARHAVEILAYCVMPDHVHLLVQNVAGTDVVRFVRHFKQATGYPFKQANGATLWQTSFYDRALRRDEDLEAIVRYILQNPVTAGLVEKASEYTYAGCVFEIPDVVASGEQTKVPGLAGGLPASG